MDLNALKRIHFEPIDSENRKDAESLEVFSEQAGFIESVSECLEEADGLELWRPVGIYDGDNLVGFAMYGYFQEPAPGQLWLDRLLIDKKYQGKGYGKLAVVADSPEYKRALKASAALMDTLSERLSKEDYKLVKELREQVAIAQCEENESHFKYGSSAGLLVRQKPYEQVSQKGKE